MCVCVCVSECAVSGSADMRSAPKSVADRSRQPSSFPAKKNGKNVWPLILVQILNLWGHLPVAPLIWCVCVRVCSCVFVLVEGQGGSFEVLLCCLSVMWGGCR